MCEVLRDVTSCGLGCDALSCDVMYIVTRQDATRSDVMHHVVT